MQTDQSQLSAERLGLLYRLSQAFNSTLDLDEVLNRVMDEVIAITRAERGFVMLQEQDGRLHFHAARGIDQQTIDTPEFHISRGLVARVAEEGQPILTSDAQSDERLSMRHSVVNLRLRAILCVPMRVRDKLVGVIYVDNRLHTGIFTQADLELLTAVAATAAIAIDNARLYKLAIEKGRIERELQMARDLQRSLLPQHTPRIPSWQFIARWQPARQVAGDFYDFIPVGEQLGLLIADVSDKGMASALFMVLSRSILRASLSQAIPVDGVTQANRLICADSVDGMFVTLFYGLLDPATGDLTYVNAGHDPALLYQAATDQWQMLWPTGPVLGIDEAMVYEQRTIRLNPNDFLLLYTDGVTDALNSQGQEFGRDRLRQIAAAERRAPADTLVGTLEQALYEFVGGSEPFDDVTILLVKRLAIAIDNPPR
jgi:phosphoserine phosphatase RsbU/P